MLDTRAYDGWRRLTRSVLEQAGNDDPEALAQLARDLEDAQAKLAGVAARLREQTTQQDGRTVPGYSWTDIGRALGISRQAAQKRFTARNG